MIEALGEKGGKFSCSFSTGEFLPVAGAGFKEVINAHNQGKETGKILVVSELDGGGVRDEGTR